MVCSLSVHRLFPHVDELAGKLPISLGLDEVDGT